MLLVKFLIFPVFYSNVPYKEHSRVVSTAWIIFPIASARPLKNKTKHTDTEEGPDPSAVPVWVIVPHRPSPASRRRRLDADAAAAARGCHGNWDKRRWAGLPP